MFSERGQLDRCYMNKRQSRDPNRGTTNAGSMILWFGRRYDHLRLGKSKGGLTNGGLSPKFSEKIGGKSFLENRRAFSGQIGAISGLVGAFSGPIGTNSSAPHSHGGRAEIAPKGPFLARLAPFGLSPPLLSPRLDFPDTQARDSNRGDNSR